MEPPDRSPTAGPLYDATDASVRSGSHALARLTSRSTLDLVRAFFDRDCARNRRHGVSACAFVRVVLQLLRAVRSTPGDAELLCAEARAVFARVDVHGEGLVSFAQFIEFVVRGGLNDVDSTRAAHHVAVWDRDSRCQTVVLTGSITLPPTPDIPGTRVRLPTTGRSACL